MKYSTVQRYYAINIQAKQSVAILSLILLIKIVRPRVEPQHDVEVPDYKVLRTLIENTNC